MCVAVPLTVKEVNGHRAVLESSGVLLEADVSLVPEVQPGDFLLIHAGFAIARLDPAKPMRSLPSFVSHWKTDSLHEREHGGGSRVDQERSRRTRTTAGNHGSLRHSYGLHCQAWLEEHLTQGSVALVSGPGCPVCVTPRDVVDNAASYADRGYIVASYGDMVRVPGAKTTLAGVRSLGGDVRVVCSPLEVLEMAASSPHRKVVFLAVGFETTAPGTALLLRDAMTAGLDNIFLLTAHRLIPPAMRALLASGAARISGFICPGHVAAVIGLEPYRKISMDYRVPCVVSGFEPLDILQSILMIVRQIRTERSAAENQYHRAVRPEGNRTALALVDKYFATGQSYWRGLGEIPASGLALREDFGRFDAARRFGTEVIPDRQVDPCACGQVLRGLTAPADCRCFAASCTPETPMGPCMVSSEGACFIRYRYAEGVCDE